MINLLICDVHDVDKNVSKIVIVCLIHWIIKNTRTWKCINFCIFSFFINVVWPIQTCWSSSRLSTNYNPFCFRKKPDSFLKTLQSLCSQIMTSKIKHIIFVFYRIFSCSLMSWSITVWEKHFFPVFEIVSIVLRKNSSIQWNCWWIKLWASYSSFWSNGTSLKSLFIIRITTPSASFKMNINMIWVSTSWNVICSWCSV